jgi:hypothetical protein
MAALVPLTLCARANYGNGKPPLRAGGKENMNDTERLDFLEKLIWSDGVGNGVALFPFLGKLSNYFIFKIIHFFLDF